MQQSLSYGNRRSPRNIITKNTSTQAQKYHPQLYQINIDYALETLDNSHALAYLRTYQSLSQRHYCLGAKLAHQLNQHNLCTFFTRQCLKVTFVCQKCIQIFLEHHKEYDPEDNNLRKMIIESIQAQNKPELNQYLQGLAFIIPSSKIYRKLADDINAVGGQLQNIMIMEITQSNRKIIARNHIHQNQQILFIPKKMLITLELAKTLPLIENLLSQKIPFKSPKHNQLTIFILYQYELGSQSQFYNYLSVLPNDFSNFPIYYSEQMLSQLKGTSFLQQINCKKQDLRKDYDVLIQFDKTFQRFSFESFVKIRLLVSSRVFGIVINKIKTDAMVPFADMLNHHLPKQTSWFYSNQSEGFVIQSLKQIPLGAEIFDSYGQKCNSRFLLNYGFTIEQNLFNEVTIEISLPRLLTRLRQPILIKIRISRILQSKNFQEMISVFRFAAEQNLRSQNQFNSYNHYNEDEADINVDAIKQIEFKSRQNQIQAWNLLHNLMANRLKQYKTSFAEDKKLLQNNKMHINLRNVIILRKGQKQVVLFYQKMAKKMIKYLSGQRIRDIDQYEHYTTNIRLQQNIFNSQ